MPDTGNVSNAPTSATAAHRAETSEKQRRLDPPAAVQNEKYGGELPQHHRPKPEAHE